MNKSIAFIGAGNACLQMIKLFHISNEYQVKVICDKNTSAPAIRYANQNGIDTELNIERLANYDIDFLIELTGKNPKVMELIQQHIPEHVSIIDSTGAGMFFSLFELMWQEKSNESFEMMDNATTELSRYLHSFNDVQNNISLLSINASIEAKRAGEAGRGFAAIARAIKDLVLQSEKATTECQEELKKMEEIKNSMSGKGSNFLNLNE